MTHTLLLTYHMTGRNKYLEPIRSMAKIRLNYLKTPPKKSPAPGSESWCASKLGSLSSVIAKYKFLTGSTEFDELLAKEMPPYMRFRQHGDLDLLTSALRRNAQALRINFEGYTSEVRYTDRVLRFPSLFAGGGFAPELETTIYTPDTSLLYSTVTGDPGSAGYFPLNAVRWLTPPRSIAALVTESGTGRFTAELFHFGTDSRTMSAEFYLLKPGGYTLTITTGDSKKLSPLAAQEFKVKGPRTRISFELPPRTHCVLNIRGR